MRGQAEGLNTATPGSAPVARRAAHASRAPPITASAVAAAASSQPTLSAQKGASSAGVSEPKVCSSKRRFCTYASRSAPPGYANPGASAEATAANASAVGSRSCTARERRYPPVADVANAQLHQFGASPRTTGIWAP